MTISDEPVQLSEDQSNSSDIEKEVRKTPKPPFYKDVWFWVSMALIALFVALYCYGSYLNDMDAKNAVNSSGGVSSSSNSSSGYSKKSYTSSSPSSSVSSSSGQKSHSSTPSATSIPGTSTSRNATLKHGKLLDVKESDGILILKAKIESLSSNKLTIDQNYYSVVDYIEGQDMTGVKELQYWAVAETRDGDDTKVISFTVPKNVIDRIKSGKLIANQLGDYVDDLWILPSLRN